MHGWLHQDLNISAWVLLPIAFGVLLSRLGVQKSAARGLFNDRGGKDRSAIHAPTRLLPVAR